MEYLLLELREERGTKNSEKGEQLVPYVSEKIIPYRDNTGKEVGVICRYRNALMKITWHAPVEIEKGG